MAINWTTLTGLKSVEGSIRFLVNYSEIDAEACLRDAQNWLDITLRVRKMRARANLTLTDGNSSIDLATEVPLFLDPIRLWLQGYGALTFIHEDEIDEQRNASTAGALTEGAPNSWTVSGDTLLFDTEADATYNLVLSHYAKPTALSASNETNLYTTNFPALLRHACTAYAYIERKEPGQAETHFNMAAGMIEKIAENDDLSRRGQEFDVETV